MPVPVVLGMLHAVALPPPSPFGNGETEFADMRAAYDTLPKTISSRSMALIVSTMSSGRARRLASPSFHTASANNIRRRRSVWCESSGSKRKTLYLSAHGSHVVGWPVADGRLLLRDLSAHATQPGFVYSHTWRVGDVVIWDNRCTMHRGRPHDEKQPRDLRRATTLDTASTLDQAA